MGWTTYPDTIDPDTIDSDTMERFKDEQLRGDIYPKVEKRKSKKPSSPFSLSFFFPVPLISSLIHQFTLRSNPPLVVMGTMELVSFT